MHPTATLIFRCSIVRDDTSMHVFDIEVYIILKRNMPTTIITNYLHRLAVIYCWRAGTLHCFKKHWLFKAHHACTHVHSFGITCFTLPTYIPLSSQSSLQYHLSLCKTPKSSWLGVLAENGISACIY